MNAAAPLFHKGFHSPIGYLSVHADERAITTIEFLDEEDEKAGDDSAILDLCVRELDAYFSGTLKIFSTPVRPAGTEFQQLVWLHVNEVPFGKTKTYGDIAKTCGDIKRSRAVGLANGSNPIPIIIPCHRIIGHNGKLTGYGGGLWRKEWLLRHEAKHSGRVEIF
jgi:methylated-DNA-[protein]-cysteine S-methyltransferase